MLRIQTIKALEKIQEKNDNPEHAHCEADKALCAFLSSIGFHDVVNAYNKVKPKWYT